MLLRRRRYDGFIDGAEDGFIRGWAIDFKQPRENVVVELSSGDTAFFVRADQARDDLKKLGFGGAHAFRFKCAGSIAPGTVMHVRIANTEFQLTNSPVTVTAGIGNRLAEIAPTAMMSSFFRAMLGREIDDEAKDFYCRQLNHLSDVTSVFRGIASSEEFRNRHGQSETRGNAAAPADEKRLFEAFVENLLLAHLAHAGFNLKEGFQSWARSDMSDIHVLEALQIILEK